MSAQEREALIDLLTEVADDQFAGRLRGGYIPETADRLLAAGWSRPVPAGGVVDIERAARALWEFDMDGAEVNRQRMPWGEYRDIYVEAASSVIAAAGLLAGGVPGRSEAETEWGVRYPDDLVYFDSEEEAESEIDYYGGELVRREVWHGPWRPARVAGATEACGDA